MPPIPARSTSGASFRARLRSTSRHRAVCPSSGFRPRCSPPAVPTFPISASSTGAGGIPYVVDAGPEARTRVEVADRLEAHILEARREEIRRADAPALRREAYVVVVPTQTAEVGTWDLVIETDRPRFVRRVDVSAEATDG